MILSLVATTENSNYRAWWGHVGRPVGRAGRLAGQGTKLRQELCAGQWTSGLKEYEPAASEGHFQWLPKALAKL